MLVRKTCFVAMLCLAQAAFAQKDAAFTVSPVLQSNMVVQQGKPFKVWGTVADGSAIKVLPSWDKKGYAAQVKDGQWLTAINMPTVKKGDFTKHTLTVIHAKDTVLLDNIQIGEVWFSSGQSNMSMYMEPFKPWHNGAENYQAEIAAADYPNIRFLTIDKDTASTPQETIKGEWKVCKPSTVAKVSVVTYYFARELYRKLNIPVGCVISAYGGAAAQAFTAREVLAADPELNKLYLEPYDKAPDAKGVTGRPTLMYNAMIHPFRNLSISGFIWYQGESNAGIRGRYPKLCTAMFTGWRKDFNQGNLPFYFVQMPPYNWKKHNPLENGYAFFREEQESILAAPNTGIVCTMDVGDTTIVHPSRKRQIGERLGWLALQKNYGLKDVVYDGPKYASMKVVGDSVFVSYQKESLVNGLMLQEGKEPLHFFVSGSDQVFYPAKAVIVGNEIHLKSNSVNKPVAVRYAFTNYPFTNLANSLGIPAYPFRTDKWDKAKVQDQ